MEQDWTAMRLRDRFCSYSVPTYIIMLCVLEFWTEIFLYPHYYSDLYVYKCQVHIYVYGTTSSRDM